MDTRRGVLTGGTWCVDRNLLIDTWPNENGFATCLESEDTNGGSGSNMAIDLRKLDPSLPVGTMGAIGDDPEGQLLADIAEKNGIDRSRLTQMPGATTPLSYCFTSQQSGKRTHISHFQSSALLTPDHFDFSNLTYRILHLGLLGIHPTMDAPWQGCASGWVATLIAARQAGLICNLELCSIGEDVIAKLARPCMPHLDLLIVNDFEIGCIAGSKTLVDDETDVDACIAAARTALEMGVSELVVVHFPGGAVAIEKSGAATHQPSVSVPPEVIVGANGAGDAFAAGFLYGYHEAWDLGASLALGHATAAASLRAASTCAAVEHWKSCLTLANDWGWRTAL